MLFKVLKMLYLSVIFILLLYIAYLHKSQNQNYSEDEIEKEIEKEIDDIDNLKREQTLKKLRRRLKS